MCTYLQGWSEIQLGPHICVLKLKSVQKDPKLCVIGNTGANNSIVTLHSQINSMAQLERRMPKTEVWSMGQSRKSAATVEVQSSPAIPKSVISKSGYTPKHFFFPGQTLLCVTKSTLDILKATYWKASYITAIFHPDLKVHSRYI